MFMQQQQTMFSMFLKQFQESQTLLSNALHQQNKAFSKLDNLCKFWNILYIEFI